MKHLKSFPVCYLFLLSISIFLTICVAWLFYGVEVEQLHLLNQVIFSRQELLKNYNHLLDYLINPFHLTLNMPNFKSSKDGLHHFFQVKLLFHLVEVIILVATYPAICFIRYHLKNKTLYLYKNYFLYAAFIPMLIGLFAVIMGFDQFFTLFHQILFIGDSSWLFNPVTDPIIWVLPEEFFLHCFIFFIAVYEVIMWFFYLKASHQEKT